MISRRLAPAATTLALVAATFAVYGGVAGHEFVDLDDWPWITRNALVQEGSTPASALRAFREAPEGNWTPLTWISLQLGFTLHGLAPAGFLLTNVALHALASVLLFFACRRLTAAPLASAFVAFVFALHPLHVESVAWAAARKDVLSGVFFMLTLLAWARFAEKPSAARYAWVALAHACGLLAKPTLVTTPFVLWLLDAWPLGRLAGCTGARATARRAGLLLLEKLPLLALSVAASALTYAAQSDFGATALAERVPLLPRLGNALDAYRIYLAQSFWPSGLTVYYPHPRDGLGLARVLASGALLAFVSAVALANVRRRAYLCVGWLWFVGMLVPVIGLVQVGMQAHADRYMYLPLVGLTLALAFAVRDLVRERPALRAPVALAAVAALLALSLAAWRQTQYFRDPIALHTRNVAATERNELAHHRLAEALRRAGRYTEAEQELRSALALAPARPPLRLALADVVARQGRVEEAIPLYRAALAADPDDARANANLALALARSGRIEAARPFCERVLALDHNAAGGAPIRRRMLAGLRALASARAAAGRSDEAERLRALLADLEPGGPMPR